MGIFEDVASALSTLIGDLVAARARLAAVRERLVIDRVATWTSLLLAVLPGIGVSGRKGEAHTRGPADVE